MISKKLIALLQCLSPKEIKRFGDFLNSPFYNKSRKIVKLYKRIIKEYPGFEFGNLDNEKLHLEIFPEIKYNDATMRHLFSDILLLVEKFLVELNVNKKSSDRFAMLMDELYSRNVHSIVNKYLHDHENRRVIGDLMGSEYLLNKFMYVTQKFNYVSSIPDSFSSKNLNNTVKLLDERNKNLVFFFTVELIKGFDTLNLISKKYNLRSENQFSARFISYLDINKTLNFLLRQADLSEYSFIFLAYQKLFRTFAEFEDESNYFEFKKEIYNNLDKFHDEAKGYFFKKIVDYCILKRKSKNRKTDFDLELFTVYCEMINLKLHIDVQTNYLSPELFRNILFLAIKLSKLSWAEDFIVNYAQYLPASQRKNLVNFCYSSLYFEKGDFDRAIFLISKLKLNNILIKMDTKNLLLRIYYELGYYESALSLINTYSEFLNKTKTLPVEKKENHKEYIKFTEQLLKIKNNNDKIKLELLYKEITGRNFLLNKKWLINKINDLMKKNEI